MDLVGDTADRYLGLNIQACTMKEVYDKFGLEATTRDFIGHAMALYTTDDYITAAGGAPETIERIRLYGNSVARYGKSPYIYPLYGLGELPQGFARLSAIYGGTYMLNTNLDEVTYDGNKAVGIKATMKERGDEGDGMTFSTKAKKILGDPSYFPGKVQVVGHVLKAICILNHPIQGTDNSDSCQLIIPQSQVGRKNGESTITNISMDKLTMLKISTSPWFPPHTTYAPRVTTSPSSPQWPRPTQTTTLSSHPALSASAGSRRSSWYVPTTH